MKKLISLLLALAMILMVGAAFATGDGTGEGGETPAATGDGTGEGGETPAATGNGTGEGGETPAATGGTLTINRDSSWDSAAESKKATYTYYKIFDAVITTAASVTEATGELSGNGVVVYTISGEDAADKVAALPDIFTAELASDGKYYITLTNSSTSAADIVAALKTMVDANTTLFPGTAVTSDANPVVITGLSDAYYLISASNGKDLAVQTIGNVTINEKNDYPTVDKKQKKENGTYADSAVTSEVGKVVDFQITVHVPADATKPIVVVDTMTDGLEYNETAGLTFAPTFTPAEVATTDAGYNENATWQIKIPADTVVANRGKDIVITYSATITAAAVIDTGKENEVKLIYDEGNYIVKDDTDIETYFAGIYKVDPNNAAADMSGVTFELKDGNGTAVKVTYNNDGYYVVDPNGTSNIVETKAETDEGTTFYTIKIRGLDGEKSYTLTEKETVAGYNLLNGDVTLTNVKDEGTVFSDKAPNTFEKVENNQGAQLPSTGGIGTTIFYVVGGLLLVGAAIVLVARRKANN